MSNARKIIGPEIIEERMSYMSNKSTWYYIELLNYGLRVNSVSPEGVISVVVKYNMDGELIDQIIEHYLGAGWHSVDVTLSGTNNSLYGTTTFDFTPPPTMLSVVRKKIRKKM